jgi:hypothetical protein
MIFEIFSITRTASGSQQYIPDAVCVIIPDLSIKIWDTIFASEGVSFDVGAKKFENNTMITYL